MCTTNHDGVHRGPHSGLCVLRAGGARVRRRVSGKASQNSTSKPQMIVACPESMNEIRQSDALK